ncbi:uncharacterized mitochondrial protein AtMg00300-like [Salvia hispanica]|uniref:uncharacterized mitochondrial protein AtMg00300-like n=1 Tax=Salvia hispanica TaxID=49212 RepID=UPI00200946C0|nr:uncharacterized mitochondrial protein AtMg00300-like [Salvia hispanica]
MDPYQSSANRSMTVMKNKKVVMIGERRGSLYYLIVIVQKIAQEEVHIVKSETVNLWHKRLGHPAEGSIKELIKKGIIQGAYDKNNTPCDECILGKFKKLPYPAAEEVEYSEPATYRDDMNSKESESWMKAMIE